MVAAILAHKEINPAAEEAAEYFLAAAHVEFLDGLLIMAEVEWEHEKFFRE